MPPVLSLDITAGPIGVNARHGAEFRIARPQGSGDWLLLHFPLPMHLRDRRGEQTTRPDACILFAPGNPQHFRGSGDRMVNHYTHLRGSGMAALVAQLDLPVNQVIYPRPVEFIAEHLRAMSRERMRDDAEAGILFAALAVRLLTTLSRCLARTGEAPTPRLRSVQERVGDVRARMRSEPWLIWSVAGMARIAGLSTSRFRAVYRDLADASPQEELITARLERARTLLSDSSSLVSEVAQACGFADPHYFSRLFSRRVGVAPSAYYRSLVKKL